jgi:hypothetical protein
LGLGGGSLLRGLRGLGLILGLRSGCRWGWLLGLGKILKAKKNDKEHNGHRQHAAHIAAAAAATVSSLPRKIGIANFCQWILPIRCEESEPSGRRSSYGNGSWGKLCEILSGGTGSRPPRAKGLHRRILQNANKTPRRGPWVAMASAAYSEQVGT